ncbi:hypothetical protein KSF_009310 [Reticulibacter mediterranei]|uniref:Peptidase C14 caspase domain-containing protein n=1 Tax=Reticulibacter mediterranei TaxID=2778369 RepID=A0A8J3IE62_9CHLR|nr:tetratricopeptide repeat protein [Reticulibacter mediterranei]GHO90883.1 hypothetical protein KSF_009310 [Reticulibacter mediterranei]
MSRRLGLIIGISHYQDATFRPLQYAENDARALAQWLVNTRGGKWSPGDVQLVQGPHATQELVQPLISQTCLQLAEANDLVMIYFAGHAFVDERSGEGYLALSNTRYQQPSSGLHLPSFIMQVMARSRAAHILLILDAFQTGPTWAARRISPFDFRPLMGEPLMNSLQQQGNRFLLCSCRGNEMASEAGEHQLGLFAHHMIVGLCGPAGNNSGSISLHQLHSYLYSSLGPQQQPHLFGRVQSPSILIGDLPAPQSPSTPTPEPSSQTFSRNNAYAAPSAASPFAPTSSQASPNAHPAATVQLSPQPTASANSDLYLNVTGMQYQQQVPQLLEQAQQSMLAQNYMEAMNQIERVLQIAPNNTSALTLKGQLLGSMGRFQEALAVVDQLGQANPNNPLAWSMRAVLLSNTGQYQTALTAIERSLQLNPNDAETLAIKANILAALNEPQGGSQSSPLTTSKLLSGNEKKGGPVSFLIGAALQIGGFLVGTIGMALPILKPSIPVLASFALASFGLAVLCVNSFRGAYRHGFTRILLTLFVCLIAGGVLAVAYKFGYTPMVDMVTAPTAVATHPPMIVSVILFAGWLIAAATIPLLLAIIGFISRLIWRRPKRG